MAAQAVQGSRKLIELDLRSILGVQAANERLAQDIAAQRTETFSPALAFSTAEAAKRVLARPAPHVCGARRQLRRWIESLRYGRLPLGYNEFMTMPARASQPNPLPPPTLTPEELAARRAQERQTRTIVIVAAVTAVILLFLLALAVYWLLQPSVPTDRIRDVFIIVVALETLVVGVALIVLLVQLASLINLLQNEVRPILEATSETVRTLRGTAAFLGESVVEPVIKLNSYLASIQRVLELMGVKRK